MEVAIPGSNNNGTPFQREVREWQRLDPNTGALLTGRLEADRWINGSLNSYGKVVDSQNVSQPNGTQHSQRKQLEVIQARTSSGSMQVIRAHTVQTTSSRWTATSSSSASSSNSSSPALMASSISHTNSATTGGGYFPSSRFHGSLGLKNETTSTAADGNSNINGHMGDEENLHLNLQAKLQKQHQHLLSTAPSLKLSNLMKSTPSITNGISSSSSLNNSGSQNKAILHRSNNNSNTVNSPSVTATAAGTFNRPQRHQHSFLTSSSRQQQNNDLTATSSLSTTATAAALLQQASSTSSMSSTSTIAPTVSSRQITTTSSGTFCYDSSRYDLPTIMTDTYVGGSSVGSGKIIDICSRDLDDDNDVDHHHHDHVGGVVCDDNNDDRLHSSSTTLSSNRHSQRETTWQPSSSVTLQRGRSISTDDLSTKNLNSDGVGGSNGIGGSGNGVDGDEDYDEPAEWRRVSKIRRSFQFPSTTAAETSRLRPADLPASSVSVSKIREELENGRRLSTAMRNNHLDLVALDNILNGKSGSVSPLTARKKTASFLTAESLKEIRGKLKKLSDESLYKDDFVTKLEAEREDSPQKVVAVTNNTDTAFQYKPRSNGPVHTTNSLESRSVKYKDTSSAEWHLRRKSYGFEKMSPPDDKSMFRFENSTDSGLGRSSDLGNWSPTTDSANTSARATVITFGEQAKLSSSESKPRPMVQRRLRNRTQPQSEAESAEMKRHSIAVDESQYVRENLRKTSAVHLNGFYSKDSSPLNSGFSDDNSRRQKRVEFCKTEVHFAAESGRVNIVETDGKPPPSNNFRRRRRSSSSSNSSTSSSSTTTSSSSSMDSSHKNGLPVIHFGDERKVSYGGDSGHLDIDEEVIDDKKKNVTVSIPISLDRSFDSESRDGDEHQDEISIRGILKNKPPKPKPYHLGENIESSDALWGVQLKPVAGSRGFSGERDQTEEDFKEATVSSKSVAERVRIVEERKEGTGYSTKINLNLSNSPYEWTDTSGTLKTYYDEQLQKDFYGTSGVSTLLLNKHSPQLTEESLKSTPLIIKTLRSANQFDEAMRRLSISSNTSSGHETAMASITTKHVSSLSHITKAGNASSLNGGLGGVGGDFKTNNNNSTEINSYSYHHLHHLSDKLESSSSTTSTTTTMTSKPIAAPRLKVVGSNTNSVSHQLSQLRRMYDYAGLDSDDSARADEEVKGYFVGDLDEDDEDDDVVRGRNDDNDDDDGGFEATELSGSWSRVKAKRNELKIQTATKIHQEVPQSNIMSIELHSPLTPTIKKPELICMQAPVAKPRSSTAAVKQSTSINKQIDIQQNHHHHSQHHQTSTKSSSSSVNQIVAPQIIQTSSDANENLKIVKEARGARKLREHELSYFGIKMGSSDTTTNINDTRSITKPKLTNTISKRSLPSRKLSSSSKTEERSSLTSNKWSMPSDKPDLLRHSPILVEPQVITKTAIVAPSIGKQQQQQKQRQRSKSPVYSSDDQTDGIYENIKQPYCRQKDLERDEMILDEMTKTADQTMKAVSDEAAQKDLRRRSISRRSSKPLETIDEKFSKSISKTATRAKTTTAHRLVRESSNRPSSASSGDSLPTTPIAQRSRSKSRESVEYANVKSKSIIRPIKHRSSSGESRRSVTSSTEDITPRITKSVKRSSTKDEPLALVRHHRHSQPSQQRSLRSSTESHDRHKVTPRSSTRDRVESHDPHSRSHRSSHHAATKSDVEHKRSSHSSTVESKSSTKASSRTRATSENEKPSKSSTERVSRSKGHSSQSESRPHRSLGSKSATMSSSGGNNSDTLIQNKGIQRSTHSSSLKTAATTKRSSKDRK
ncbi:serine-rich adhesin for platelets isoform X1 [Eupeodes corollae]|uniref:serine-rich adhesin for platelets isoform X1 n=1 Tax=Eupeodes corollae TaxID=290404 RepID=UPI00249165CA|nr:serine-rich adhesin for platelets isoform X1 [Eupeodes corollae]